jgi:hypothetical protein
MNLKLRAVSEEVAGELKTKLLMESLILVELVYYSYLLFQKCHSDKAAVREHLASEYVNGEFSRKVLRPAVRQVRQEARRRLLEMTDDEMELVAKTMLLKAMSAEDDVVQACYAEAA